MKKMSKRQRRFLLVKTIRGSINILTVLGAFMLYGSFGALEVGRIEFHQFIVQCILSIALMVYTRHIHHELFGEECV